MMMMMMMLVENTKWLLRAEREGPRESEREIEREGLGGF